jgi:hypothetical protein
MDQERLKASQKVLELEEQSTFCQSVNNRILHHKIKQYEVSGRLCDTVLCFTLGIIKDEIRYHDLPSPFLTCTEDCNKKLNNRALTIFNYLCLRSNNCSFSQTCSNFYQRESIIVPSYSAKDILAFIPTPHCETLYLKNNAGYYHTELQLVSSISPGETCTCKHCTHSPFGKQYFFQN